MKRIVYRYGFWYVIGNYGNLIYTYAVCDTEEQANEVLDFIIKTYE